MVQINDMLGKYRSALDDLCAVVSGDPSLITTKIKEIPELWPHFVESGYDKKVSRENNELIARELLKDIRHATPSTIEHMHQYVSKELRESLSLPDEFHKESKVFQCNFLQTEVACNSPKSRGFLKYYQELLELPITIKRGIYESPGNFFECLFDVPEIVKLLDVECLQTENKKIVVAIMYEQKMYEHIEQLSLTTIESIKVADTRLDTIIDRKRLQLSIEGAAPSIVRKI